MSSAQRQLKEIQERMGWSDEDVARQEEICHISATIGRTRRGATQPDRTLQRDIQRLYDRVMEDGQ